MFLFWELGAVASNHSIDGWYLFTSPDYYRTHTCHVKATKSERHSDTVHFKHKNITGSSHSQLQITLPQRIGRSS